MNTNKQRQKRMDFALRNGLDAQDGPMLVEVRPLTSSAENDWTIVGALASDPTFAGGLKFNDLEIGFEKINMDKSFKGRKPTLGFSLMAANGQGMKMAFGTDSYTLVQPSTPITSDVDIATAPTYLNVTLTAVTGFKAKHKVAIKTGGTNNPQFELRHISSVNTTTKTITLVQPLDRLPVDGAEVFVVESEDINVGSGLCEDQQVRIVQILDDDSETFLTIPHATIDKDGSFKGGMDSAKSFDVSVEALANIEEDGTDIVTSYFKYQRLYKTDYA